MTWRAIFSERHLTGSGARHALRRRPMATTIFHYPTCSTCRRALKWLEARSLPHERIHIVEQPPTTAQLARALAKSGVPLRGLFNTSGQSYREGNFKERLA